MLNKSQLNFFNKGIGYLGLPKTKTGIENLWDWVYKEGIYRKRKSK
jgi:hypothetical protein